MNDQKPKFRKAVFEKAVTFMLAGFGFVAALAWNDAIQAFFNEVFGSAGGTTLIAKFSHAIIITAMVTFIAIRLDRDIGLKQN